MIGRGGTVGIIGGGQLGRMLSLAAAPLGLRVAILDPHERPCAADVAASFTRAAFDDAEALRRLADECDVLTYEFENLPVAPLKALGDKLRPSVRSLAISQDRAEEKRFIEAAGGRVAPWRTVDSLADVVAAVEALGTPIVLKTRRLGYDGKGQRWLRHPDDAAAAYTAMGGHPAVAEQGVSFEAEFSVILVRAIDGAILFFDSPRNTHENGILRRSELPAGGPVEEQEAAARRMAEGIASALGHVGVLTVEFFATADGPIVNEIAPRVHNSGHWTIEGAATSQFEQHLRAICGLPLGSTALRACTIRMDNLIGDEIAAVPRLLAEPGACVHDYGKGAPRPGRKMGHVTRLG